MTSIRFGVLGAGNIGQQHIQLLRSGQIENAVLAATASRSGGRVDEAVPHFNCLEDLLDANLCDALLIATPTLSHVGATLMALQQGVHVLLEKPLAMSVGQSLNLIERAPDGVHFGVMLNQRFHPAYAALKKLISEGVIGPVQRYSWTMTSWYRPDIYYKVSDWRGTWPGEGGGLLMNQCIHNLDIMQWLFGLPESLSAKVAFGKYHDIDVEDEVTAVLNHTGDMTGLLQASSGEAPGVNRLEIVGDYGVLSWDDAHMILMRADQSVSNHCATTLEMFGMPEFTKETIPLNRGTNQHALVIKNFVDTLLGRATLLTSADQGIGSLQLANAMLLSQWEKQPVIVPVDATRYEDLLSQKIAGSSLRVPTDVDVEVDMEKSYR
jgi:predicted dehydrogenase